MKKSILLFVMGIAFATQALFAQVPSYVPTNGLVGYWPFNGNANDASGNGNNGTVNGATLTTDRFGNNNCAYSFDGNDIITANSINFTDITISVWYKVSENSVFNPTTGHPPTGSQIIGQGTQHQPTAYCDFSIGLSNSNSINQIAFEKSTVPPTYYEMYNINTNFNFSSWVNLVAVLNSNNIKIYMDGILVDTFTVNSDFIQTGDFLSFGARYIQNSTNPLTNFFTGKIDDIGIWNRALSQTEIVNLYNSSQISSYTDTCNNVSGSLTQGLVGYWPFCGNANDDSGNGNHGIVNGATLTTDRFGNVNSAYVFSTNSEYISGVSNNLNGTKFSVSLWVWIDGMNNTTLNCFKFGSIPQGSTDGGYRIYANLNGGELGVQMANGTSLVNSNYNNNSLQNWHHVVGVYDSSNLILYVDGVLRNNVPASNFNISYANQNFYIGNNGNTNNSNLNLRKLDDIGIWNRALSQQEVTQLFNQNQCFTNITVTDTLIINVGQLSFTNPVTYANNITIAPNPASTQITISFNNITDLTGGTINVVNALGQQVATTPITASGTNTSMALNTWGSNGMYYVQIVNANGVVVDVKKIILQ